MPSTSVSTRTLRWLCLALITLGLLAAGFVLRQRVHAEYSSRAVEVVIDYNEVATLAALRGQTIENLLPRLKAAGATAVAVQEETLKTLEEQGLTYTSGPRYTDNPAAGKQPGATAATLPLPRPMLRYTLIEASNQQVNDLLVTGLRRVFPKDVENFSVYKIRVYAPREVLQEIGLGLLPVKVAQINGAGLHVVPRMHGTTDASAQRLTAALAAIAGALPAARDGHARGLLVFDGDTLPGYRELIPTLAEELRKQGLIYGSVEFGKQKGDEKLGEKLGGELVRVHSISPDELATLELPEAVQRFALAIKDRNIRVLFVHFPPLSGDDPVQNAEDYLKAVVKATRRDGFIVDTGSPAHPFVPLSLPAGAALLLFAAAGAGFALWVLGVLPATLPRGWVRLGYIKLAALVLLAAVVAFVPTESRLGGALHSYGRILFSLLAAIGFPLLALNWAYRRIDWLVEQQPIRALRAAIGALLVTTVITLCGALLVAAMMSETRFLVKVGQFEGVKAALAVPLLFFMLLLLTDGIAKAGEALPDYWARCRANISRALGQPIYLWGILLALLGLAAVALLLVRSGNDAPATVSATELHFRAILERFLIARPRTKEFAIGFPLFLFSMLSAARGKRTVALVLLIGGAIGEIDVLNTYCHAHTPLLLSLLRTVNGLWLGIIIGALLLAVFARSFLPQRTQRKQRD